jgi:hypothetical protein
MYDARPWDSLADAELTNVAVSKKHAAGTYEAIVVERLDNRNSLLVRGVVSGW